MKEPLSERMREAIAEADRTKKRQEEERKQKAAGMIEFGTHLCMSDKRKVKDQGAKAATGALTQTTAQSLGSILKSARDIMRKDKGGSSTFVVGKRFGRGFHRGWNDT